MTIELIAASALILTVEIADRGIAWGRQTLRMMVENDFIRSLETIAFRLLL